MRLRYAVFFVFGFSCGFGTLLVWFWAYIFPGPQSVAQVQPTPIVLSATPTSVAVSNAPELSTVLSALESSGIQLRDIDTSPNIAPDSPLPRGFEQHATWNDALLGDRGGQLFICNLASACATLYAYFQLFPGLSGPVYLSLSSKVLVQLNSAFTTEQAERYRVVIERF